MTETAPEFLALIGAVVLVYGRFAVCRLARMANW